MGYRVGKGGGTEADRRLRLFFAYLAELPSDMSDDEAAEWGESSSCTRLAKIARSIAAFCRSAKKRRDPKYSRAISDWEADLTWLRDGLYNSRCRFRWPSTYVP